MVSIISGNPAAASGLNTTAPASASASGLSDSTVAPHAVAPVTQPQLDEALKQSGFKGEIDTSNPGQVIVRIVDNVTGRTVVQMPSATALAFAAAVRKFADDQAAPPLGSLLDQAA